LVNLKRRYFDMRIGAVTIAPMMQMGNFLMLSYLTINNVIPIYIFAPLFIVGVIFSFTLIGNKFRKVQTSTDINMQYEKATENAKTQYMILCAQKRIMGELHISSPHGFDERLEYMGRVSEGKI
jgi:hypothetical protein